MNNEACHGPHKDTLVRALSCLSSSKAAGQFEEITGEAIGPREFRRRCIELDLKIADTVFIWQKEGDAIQKLLELDKKQIPKKSIVSMMTGYYQYPFTLSGITQAVLKYRT